MVQFSLRKNKTKKLWKQKDHVDDGYKLLMRSRSAETKWRRLRGFKLLVDVVKDIRFIDGVKEMETHQQATA